MRATLIYGPGDIRVEDVPDPAIVEPTDAIVRITHACICGSDLWPYKQRAATNYGDRIGHEFIGVVEETGNDVTTVKAGDVVVAPFVASDGTCDFCHEGWTTSCRNINTWGGQADGGQGEAARVPWADGTLYKLPVTENDPLMPSLLTLSDVYSTGYHAAITAGVTAGTTVTVIGDGAVGLCGVLAAHQLGAEHIILMGRHTDRTNLGREFGANDVVAERGDEGVNRIRELTGGDGTQAVLECVGTEEALETSIHAVRAGGTISRVGMPQYEKGRLDTPNVFFRNVTVSGGVAPARSYIPRLLPGVLDGKVEPGRVFDTTIGLDETPDGYRAMNNREALKVMIRP